MSLSRIPLDRVFRNKLPKLDTQSSPTSQLDRNLPSPPSSFSSIMATQPPTGLGARTPQMLEYERQAEERAKEQDRMQEERDRMALELSNIRKEQDRIAQEEYEMRQYYEAEALRHAEEKRLHEEEVRRHQERVREHERRIRDHEASSEAFAKVIAMPAKMGRDRQTSFMSPVRAANGNGNANGNGFGNGSPPASFPNGN